MFRRRSNGKGTLLAPARSCRRLATSVRRSPRSAGQRGSVFELELADGLSEGQRDKSYEATVRGVAVAAFDDGQAWEILERLRGLLDGAEQAHPDRVDELRTMIPSGCVDGP